jgi:hypothetical protein
MGNNFWAFWSWPKKDLRDPVGLRSIDLKNLYSVRRKYTARSNLRLLAEICMAMNRVAIEHTNMRQLML